MSAQKPVAIRITRPYPTEDEFFAAELDTISRTGVTLVGAQQRPDGVVLRFELALASGTPLLRGEGRVVGFKAKVIGDEPGLVLRFTRLDSKSKALVDRVAQMQSDKREAKRSIPPPASAKQPPPPPPPAPPEAKSSGDLIPISVEVPVVAPPAPPPDPSREAVLSRLRLRKAALSGADVDRILSDGAQRRR